MAGSFSFDTPEEVMHILASVRQSGATLQQQSELRDLVLSYTNGGKDPSLKLQIEQKLTALQITPTQTKTTLSVDEPLDFGSSRTVPSFHAAAPVQPAPPAPVSPTPATTPAPVAPPVSPAAPAPAAPAPAQVPVMSPVAAPPSAPVSPAPATAPAPTVAPTQSAANTTVPNASPAVAPVTQTAQADQVPAAPVVPTPATSTELVDNESALRRIREIKALVNQQVGNPVNLVDIDNTIGRSYMAALLAAMKSVNTGADATESMAQLESAFQAVERLLSNREAAPVATPPVVEPAPSTSTAPMATANPVPISTTAPKASSAVLSDDSASRWANTQIRVPDSVPPVQRPPTQTTAPTSASTVPVAAPIPVGQPAIPTDESTAAKPIVPLSAAGEPLKTVEQLPDASSLETSTKAGDPLYTHEVSDGLNQLLSDWVLFRKSGLLGTGPKGIAHPLYAKIKDLEIPILLAGRFEGATQEIKQSITDYMNGWRYEQGIIYEQGETFEHYLRRVIRHILDLQK